MLIFILTFNRHLGKKMRQKRFFAGPKKTPMDEAREALAVQVLAHVPVRACPSGKTNWIVLKITCTL
jgi:hypothetical protein